MGFEILTAEGADAARWRELIEALPPERRDIHFLPEYGRIYRDVYAFEPILAVYRAENRYVLQPFTRRPLKALPFLAHAPDAYAFSDLANAYGYGGPLSNVGGSDAADLFRLFARDLQDWCNANRIASEFGSLHPLMIEHQRTLIGNILPIGFVKDVVVVDLRPDQSAILKGLRKGHRSSIALARHSGVRVEQVGQGAANLNSFRAMYEATMLRRQAADRWYWPRDFFQIIHSSLGEGHTTLLFAFVGNELESACLLTHDRLTAYYQFAGTCAKHRSLGVNNLIVWEAAMLAKRAGYQWLHLGGGVTADPDDGVWRFKAGFSRARAPLYTYFTVRNRAAYEELSKRKQAYERRTTGVESQDDFLPLYRRQEPRRVLTDSFEILSAEGSDAARWTELVDELAPEHRDIHFSPEYGRIYRDCYSFTPFLTVYRDQDGYVLQSFVRRRLGDLPFLSAASDGNRFSDVTNPYGYGGPLCRAAKPERAMRLYSRFVDAFSGWCNEQGIASEFCSLHPLMTPNQQPLMNGIIEPRHEKDVVIIDLRPTEEALGLELRTDHRRSIRVARRAGVQIERVEPTVDNLALLRMMYEATMLRQNAAGRWFLPQDFFESTVRHLGPKRVSLFFASVDGELEVGTLLMHDFGTAYSHFSGSFGKYPNARARSLMAFETALWAKQSGFSNFHLGGGVTRSADDRLLQWKAGFTGRLTPLYTYFAVRDVETYNTLCDRKRAYERQTTAAESQSDFLPLYRR
jgi:serine/alanine adding enzyme